MNSYNNFSVRIVLLMVSTFHCINGFSSLPSRPIAVPHFQLHSQSTKQDTDTDHIHLRAQQQQKEEEENTRKTKRDWTSSATTITGKWRLQYEALQEFAAVHGHTRVPYNYTKNPSLGRWVYRQRHLYNQMQNESTSKDPKSIKKVRPATVLSQERIEALENINFSFESPRKRTWNKRFEELCTYRALHGDCLVPFQYDTIPGLSVWVRNQRTQYRNLLLGRRNTLTPDRIAALQSIGFVWDTQRNDLWKKRYDELKDFQSVYGHTSVPEKYHENLQLGTWVNNQRTAYKNFFAGKTGFSNLKRNDDGEGSEEYLLSSKGGLTGEKIAALEKVGFCWDQRTYNWYSMFERLKKYKKEKMQLLDSLQNTSAITDSDDNVSDREPDVDILDTSNVELFHVPPEDVDNRDLRLWISVQRKEYSSYMYNKNNPDAAIKKRSSMTPRRKRLLDTIDFPWNVSKQRYISEGPTTDDWSQLFEQMREKGIDKNARPKEHWFEGESLVAKDDPWVTEKDTWTDEDLLELWNMEDDAF